MKRAKIILTVDSLAGLAVGILTLMLTPLLTGPFFAWPIGYVFFIGGANVLYGCFSGLLTLQGRRKQRLARAGVILLIMANSIWAGQCLAQIWWLTMQGDPAIFLLMHMGAEAAFVSVLAYLEARDVLPQAG